MLEVSGVERYYGKKCALGGVSFSAEAGEVIGIIGPNGAGKSSLMRIIAGYIEADKGEVLYKGKEIKSYREEISKEVGYLAEGCPYWGGITPREHLRFIAEIYGVKSEGLGLAVETTNIGEMLDISYEELSKGYRRRAALACAIMHGPSLLLLDEPTDGLDPNQKREVRKLIKERSGGKVTLISTHILEEVSALCDRVILIDEGKIVRDKLYGEFIVEGESDILGTFYNLSGGKVT